MTSAYKNFNLQASSCRETSSSKLQTGARTSVRSNVRSLARPNKRGTTEGIPPLLRTEVRAPAASWNLIIRASLKLEVWGLKFRTYLTFLTLLTNLSVPALASEPPHAGPLLHDFPLTLSRGHRTEALGPLFYFEENEGQRTWALPPLISHMSDSVADIEEFDFLYPVVTYDRYGSQHRLQFFQLLSFNDALQLKRAA